ncbi:MAG: ANTAR domain-containing protein [Planktomarina sp.]|nr:ANTAR domain-containing protein [Planktomarina sp.]|tara:strand:- start:43 stop:660 length:618 start_codon:yes stop_codon:yes gene_type:complete
MLQNLKGLNVQLIHRPDEDGLMILDHLKRIGCICESTWPMPESINKSADVVLLNVEKMYRADILKLVSNIDCNNLTFLAVTSYENPGTLQIILECKALAVIEKPIRPFGLLANLTVARTLWLEREKIKGQLCKVEKEYAASIRISKAKAILMSQTGINESEAYKKIRNQAMSKRITTVDIASAIINSYELLSPNNTLSEGGNENA